MGPARWGRAWGRGRDLVDDGDPRHLASAATATAVARRRLGPRSLLDRPATAAALVVAGVLPMMVAGAIDAPAAERQRELERDGTPVPATVESRAYDPRLPDRVEVSFAWDGRLRSVELWADGLDRGDEVTVLVDPDDPARATIEGHRQQSPIPFGFSLLLAVVGALCWAAAAWLVVRCVRRRLTGGRARRRGA